LVQIVVYYYDTEIKKLVVDHTQWNDLVPNVGIQKIWYKLNDVWHEIHGWNAYVVQEYNNDIIICGISHVNPIFLTGEKYYIPLEEFVNSKGSLKFGSEIPLDKWNDVLNRSWE